MGSLISRGLVMAFGYAYPAYECFKTVEKNKPEIEQLRFWCQYWILVAVLTVCERIGDAFVSWVPMYSEAKLAFYIYLWFPKTRGAAYVYDAFFKPYVAKHETDIDHNLLELKTRTGNIAALYWQKVSGYGQKRIYEILQYIASQSVPNTHHRQTQQPGARCRQNSVPQNCQPVVTTQPPIEPRSPSLSAACEDEDGLGKAVVRSKAPPGNSAGPVSNALETTVPEPLPAVVLNTKKTSATLPNAEIVRECIETDMDPMQIEPASSRNEIVNPLRETVMHEAIQVTRGRSSKT